MMRKAAPWVATLSASVRPIITYLFFFEFLALTWAMFFGLIDADQYAQIWSNEMQAIWAAVISFWFGQRTMSKWGKAA